MGRKQHNGLQIRRSAKRAASADWTLPILSGVVIHALMGLTGLERPWFPVLAGTAVCGISLAFGKRKWFYSGAMACLVLSLLVLRSRVPDGFCQWHNGMGAVNTAQSGIVLPALEASGNPLNLLVFTCWLAGAVGMGIVFLSQFGKETVCVSVLVICGGVSIALGRMIDPLPLILAVVMLCTGRGWKYHLLPVGILVTAVLISLIPGFSDWAEVRSDEILRAVHSQRYETKYTTLLEGRLEPIRQSDSAALIVTMEKPEVLYLRGFTGARFNEDRWLPLDTQILAENQELLYWLNSREFDLRAQFEATASDLETGMNTVTIQNVGACSAYRYIPFTICSDEDLVPENLKETAEGKRYDSFTIVYGGAAMLTDVLTALESENTRYLQAEAAYREFVEEHYLDIPEGLAERMQSYWEKTGGMDAQEAVNAVLTDCFPDGIQHDPWYATAAVLTLRHFGIPARYAEGYIIPQTTATTVELTGRNAACWGEVYRDGIGWIPMELTPGRNEEIQQQEQQQTPDTPEETIPPQTEPTTEPEPDGGYQVRIARFLLSGSLVVILLLVVAATVLILRRNHILKKRQAILDQDDIREAVTWSFANSIRTLERMGIHRGNGSLDALTTPIRQHLGAEFAEQFESASRINARALFSGKPMTESDRKAVHGFRQCILACLQVNSNRLSRLWMKYILCVF